MAYTLCDQNGNCRPLQIIVPDVHGYPEVKAQFIPHWWVCDPCARSEERYQVVYRPNQPNPTCFAWYQIVTTDDSPEDIDLKINHYLLVIAARERMDEAGREYRRLTGCGYSTTPRV